MESDVSICLINLKKFLLLFVSSWAGSSLLHGFSLAVVSRSSSLAAVLGLPLLRSVGSGARAQQLLCGK